MFIERELKLIGINMVDAKTIASSMQPNETLVDLLARQAGRIYHRKYKNQNTQRFLRTVSGLSRHLMLNPGHINAIFYEASYADVLEFGKIMKRFWGSPISHPMYKQLQKCVNHSSYFVIVAHWSYFYFPIKIYISILWMCNNSV